jgi:hypothetical protein
MEITPRGRAIASLPSAVVRHVVRFDEFARLFCRLDACVGQLPRLRLPIDRGARQRLVLVRFDAGQSAGVRVIVGSRLLQ